MVGYIRKAKKSHTVMFKMFMLYFFVSVFRIYEKLKNHSLKNQFLTSFARFSSSLFIKVGYFGRSLTEAETLFANKIYEF